MSTAFLTEVRETLLPGRDGGHGPLPPVLISMTLVTGLVDAFSYLGAVVGTVLIRHAQVWWPLLIALAVIVAGAAATYRLGKLDPPWVRTSGGQSR
jgi:hypothetical protein